jgi:hypothetical protein
VKNLRSGTSIYWLGKGYPLADNPGGDIYSGQTTSPGWAFIQVREPRGGMPITVVTYIEPGTVGRYKRLRGYQRLLVRTRMPDGETVDIRVPTHLRSFPGHPGLNRKYEDELIARLAAVPPDVNH